ncbi:MAG: Rieske (2Fe-2S) protein [Cellvibrionaceae bacterium]
MHFLCNISDIPENGSKGFELENLRLFAVQKRGEIFIYKNICPHAQLPLEWVPDQFLDNNKELILCSSHGALFQIHDGLCVTGPCIGQSLEAIPFSVKNQQIFISF